MINYKPFPNNPLRQFFGYHRLSLTLCMQILRKCTGICSRLTFNGGLTFLKEMQLLKESKSLTVCKSKFAYHQFWKYLRGNLLHFEFCFANKEYSPKENYLCGYKSNHLFDILLPKELKITLATLAWVPFSKDNFSYTKCSQLVANAESNEGKCLWQLMRR